MNVSVVLIDRLISLCLSLSLSLSLSIYLLLSWIDTVAQVVERPLCGRKVMGSILDRIIPKTFKMVLGALLLGAQHYES